MGFPNLPFGSYFSWLLFGILINDFVQMFVGVIAFNVLKVLEPSDPRAVGVLLTGYVFQGIGFFMTYVFQNSRTTDVPDSDKFMILASSTCASIFSGSSRWLMWYYFSFIDGFTLLGS